MKIQFCHCFVAPHKPLQFPRKTVKMFAVPLYEQLLHKIARSLPLRKITLELSREIVCTSRILLINIIVIESVLRRLVCVCECEWNPKSSDSEEAERRPRWQHSAVRMRIACTHVDADDVN